MFINRRATRALALGSAAAALAVPTIAAASPIDAGSLSAPSEQSGPPAWPANPEPLRAARPPADNDGGIGWEAIAFGATGVALVGGIAVVTRRARPRDRRPRTTS